MSEDGPLLRILKNSSRNRIKIKKHPTGDKTTVKKTDFEKDMNDIMESIPPLNLDDGVHSMES